MTDATPLVSARGISKSFGGVEIHGRPVVIKEPTDAIALGIALVSEDRAIAGCGREALDPPRLLISRVDLRCPRPASARRGHCHVLLPAPPVPTQARCNGNPS